MKISSKRNTVFSSLIQLQADIQSTIKTNAIDISQGNTQITTAKKSWTDSKRELKNEYATNLAANPLKRSREKYELSGAIDRHRYRSTLGVSLGTSDVVPEHHNFC